jgi:hypothetical protein
MLTRVHGVYGCPFCGELFREGEASVCPRCEIALQPLHALPASPQLREQQALATPPDRRALPWTDWGRGRAGLALCSTLGVLLFFTPWVRVQQPDLQTLTGADLARRLFWLWANLTAWSTLLALVVTRRTPTQMRGARFVIAMLSLLPALAGAVLWWTTPSNDATVPRMVQWQGSFYANLLLGIVASVMSLRFGGAPPPSPVQDTATSAETSDEPGPTVH